MTHEIYKKLSKHFFNGITHNLILWIISRETIHGYGIMKILNEFFIFENSECDFVSSSSKIYPILSKMEKSGLIEGKWDINENNKRVKFYSITAEGEDVLSYIQNNMKYIIANQRWREFFLDMAGVNLNEKRD